MTTRIKSNDSTAAPMMLISPNGDIWPVQSISACATRLGQILRLMTGNDKKFLSPQSLQARLDLEDTTIGAGPLRGWSFRKAGSDDEQVIEWLTAIGYGDQLQVHKDHEYTMITSPQESRIHKDHESTMITSPQESRIRNDHESAMITNPQGTQVHNDHKSTMNTITQGNSDSTVISECIQSDSTVMSLCTVATSDNLTIDDLFECKSPRTETVTPEHINTVAPTKSYTPPHIQWELDRQKKLDAMTP